MTWRSMPACSAGTTSWSSTKISASPGRPPPTAPAFNVSSRRSAWGVSEPWWASRSRAWPATTATGINCSISEGQMAAGAVRGGRSGLAGLLRCASCGRRLQVSYSGGASRYSCRRNHQAGCGLAFGGPRLEAAIERELLRVLTPGAIDAALASAERTTEEAVATHQALELELREAQYEAGRAQRQYDAVEPENRLVADTLERRWNVALERI